MSLQTPETQFSEEFPELVGPFTGQFHIEREIGRGGMGVVYLARELKLDRLVAIKILPARLAREPDTRERFLREARTAARLAHPNVVPVYRADEAGGTAFFAMAFIEGESLADRVRDRGTLTPREAVPILRDVAWALAYAHARGVVHRDVKPENILLERSTGRTLVTDFGIAHHTAVSDAAARLTQDGHVLGTMHYMSPEQVTGEELDGRSDLYALGVVAYNILSARLPFDDLSGPAILVAHATKAAPPIESFAPDLPSSLAAVVNRCLAKNPGDRYASGEALAIALDRALADSPIPAQDFPPGLPERLDEDQATAIWKRAAQLQADALNRLDSRPVLIARGDNRDGSADAATVTPSQGYRLVDVASAASEAGISRQYVAMALAELPKGGLPTSAASQKGANDRIATQLLGTDVRSLGVSVVIPASAARTLRALGTVLQQSPYELQLRETVGAHPLDGGVIVFDLTGVLVGFGASASDVNFYWMGTHQQLQARQLQVTLKPVHGDGHGSERTEITMTADLRPGVLQNVRASKWMAAGLGSFTGVFTAAVLAKGAAVLGSVAVLGPAALVFGAVAGVSLAGYRLFYPTVLKKSQSEMRKALEAVGAAVQSETVFGTLPGPGRKARSPYGSGGDGGTVIIV